MIFDTRKFEEKNLEKLNIEKLNKIKILVSNLLKEIEEIKNEFHKGDTRFLIALFNSHLKDLLNYQGNKIDDFTHYVNHIHCEALDIIDCDIRNSSEIKKIIIKNFSDIFSNPVAIDLIPNTLIMKRTHKNKIEEICKDLDLNPKSFF